MDQKEKKYYLIRERVFQLALELDDIERVFQMELESIEYDYHAFVEVYNTLVDLSRLFEAQDE